MADDAAAEAPPAEETPKEYKLRSIGDEGLAAIEDVDGKADVVLAAGDKQYVVVRAAAEMIPLVGKCLEEHDPDKGAEKEEVHLGQVTSIALPVVKPDIAAVILAYCEQSIAAGDDQPRIEKPLRGKVEDIIPEWCKKLVTQELINEGDEKQHDKLFDVLLGAHALGVKPLEELCGLTAASLLKGKTSAEIGELFGLTNDFQPEEIEKMQDDAKNCVY